MDEGEQSEARMLAMLADLKLLDPEAFALLMDDVQQKVDAVRAAMRNSHEPS